MVRRSSLTSLYRLHLKSRIYKRPTSATSLYYDPLDRLVEYDTTVSTRFVQDGAEISTEVDNPAGAILRRYVRGDGADEALVWYEGSGTSDRRFLSADERGSIVSVTDGSGALVAINSYDEYGIPAATNHGRFQYSEHRSHAGGMARSGG